MALPNVLALVFAAATVANGLSDVVQLGAFRALPAKAKNDDGGASSPLPTFQRWLPYWVEIATRYHLVVHGSTLASLTWSLLSSPSTWNIIAAALIFEIASLVLAATWIMPVLGEIDSATSDLEIGRGLDKVRWRQLVRTVSLHAACMVCCALALVGHA